MLADLCMIHTLQTVLHKQSQLLKNSCIMFPFIQGFYLPLVSFFFSFKEENFSVKNDTILSCAIPPN